MERKTCCITGHRPNAFPWKDHTEDIRFHILLKRIENAIDFVLDLNVRRFICGNALGVDTWAAQIILKKKQYHPDIYLEIVLPFSLHNSNNSSCKDVQEKADLVHIVSTQRCRKAAFFERDKYMIDNSDMVIAVYDDKVSRKGGTQRTFVMAEKKGLNIIQVLWGDI